MQSIAGDLTEAQSAEAAITECLQRFGRIDHLIANLGSGRGMPGWDQSEAEWRRLFEVNFFASIRLTQAALPHLLANANGGSILYISSIVALESTAAPLPYSAAKAALVNYSKNLARQLGHTGVRVNCIAPGNIAVPGGTWQRRLDEDPAGLQALLDAEVPQRRLGGVADIASLAAYLCSGRAEFVTGACFVVDGGQTRGW